MRRELAATAGKFMSPMWEGTLPKYGEEGEAVTVYANQCKQI